MTANEARETPPPDVRDPLPVELRDPAFPPAVRGYERHAVDGYVERVNGLLAELQVSAWPKAAMRRALDRAGEQTRAMLQQADATADDITSRARGEAEATVEQARGAADEIVAAARREADEVLARAKAAADETVRAARTRTDPMASQRRAPGDDRQAGLGEMRRVALRLGHAVGGSIRTTRSAPPAARPPARRRRRRNGARATS